MIRVPVHRCAERTRCGLQRIAAGAALALLGFVSCIEILFHAREPDEHLAALLGFAIGWLGIAVVLRLFPSSRVGVRLLLVGAGVVVTAQSLGWSLHGRSSLVMRALRQVERAAADVRRHRPDHRLAIQLEGPFLVAIGNRLEAVSSAFEEDGVCLVTPQETCNSYGRPWRFFYEEQLNTPLLASFKVGIQGEPGWGSIERFVCIVGLWVRYTTAYWMT